MLFLTIFIALSILTYFLFMPSDIELPKRTFESEIFDLVNLDGLSKGYIVYLIIHSKKRYYLEEINKYLLTPSKTYNLTSKELKSLRTQANKKEEELLFAEWKKQMLNKAKTKLARVK